MKKDTIIKESFLMCLLGTKYKSKVILDLLPAWVEDNPKGEIIAFDPKHICAGKWNIKYYIENDNDFKWVDNVLEYCNGTNRNVRKLLVLDGGDILFPRYKHPLTGKYMIGDRPACPNSFNDLLTMKRFYNMDIIITFQTPDAMPIRLEYYVSDYIVLPIEEEYQLSEENPNYLALDNCIRAINAYYDEHHNFFEQEWENVHYLHIGNGKINASASIDKKKFKEIINEFDDIKNRVEIE